MKVTKKGPRFSYMKRPTVPKDGPSKEPRSCLMKSQTVPKDGPQKGLRPVL